MLDFYGLREQPFTLLPNPRLMVLSQPPDWIGGRPYQETKAKPIYFPKDRTASLYGPVGSGKTSLLRLIAQEVHGAPGTNVFSAVRLTFRARRSCARIVPLTRDGVCALQGVGE